MPELFSSSPSLEGLLNLRFRRHDDRDWEEWGASHAYGDTSDVPFDAERAWIGRQKLNYRGIGGRKALRHLIANNVDQAFLEEVSALPCLERLELESPMVASDLSPLLSLNRLTFLSIDSPRKIADFQPLLRLPSLRTLIIANPKQMTDLEWLTEAHHLEVIGIEGGMWSPYKIPSLQPLAGLQSLRAFLGVSTKLLDKQLMPLAECPRLTFMGVACMAPREEFERLQRARPDLVCAWFRPEAWRTLSR